MDNPSVILPEESGKFEDALHIIDSIFYSFRDFSRLEPWIEKMIDESFMNGAFTKENDNPPPYQGGARGGIF